MSEDLNKVQLITARYGEKDRPKNIIWNSQIENLLSHRSVRNFSQQALPEYWFETLVAAAQSASTSSNLQQWSMVAVTDPALKAQVRKLAAGDKGVANGYIEEAPAILLWIADLSRNHDMTVSDGLIPGVHDYLDSFVMATVDAALASQNATVAAESIGLGTVYIGATRNKAKELAELIQLPAHSYVVCGLVVGWPATDSDAAIRPRLPQSVVAHHNLYSACDLDAHVRSYEEAFHAFREGLGMKDKTWKQAVQSAATSLAYMDGRQNLRTTLEERGFGFK
ncbi:nitroreductase family protein [Enterobacter sp. V87_3]|uniref:nitroreductase family protein n=1 Tax=Enterobacter sp. V87_3 TaxID=3044236 RepID=UPI00249F0557|nr:nitroreductase family protein [Enterobacter sp. V87_3]MDI3426791.1 nitroreductase family protein [Enterobacter sp. V87_3]